MKFHVLAAASLLAIFSAPMVSHAQAPSDARSATTEERTSFKNFLYALNASGDYRCFRNLDSYRDVEVVRNAIRNYSTFVDRKTGDVYVPAKLKSMLPIVPADFPHETTLRHIRGDLYSFEYELRFKPVSGTSTFTEMKFTQNVPVVVRHVFELRDGRFIYRQSSSDLVRGTKTPPASHVRCAKVQEVEELGFLWGTNRIQKMLPLEGIDLLPQRCHGTSETCGAIPQEPMIIRN
ncbi:hypothetical protein BH10BDE1_BH10BDE1_34190 [soil metagenome]